MVGQDNILCNIVTPLPSWPDNVYIIVYHYIINETMVGYFKKTQDIFTPFLLLLFLFLFAVVVVEFCENEQ